MMQGKSYPEIHVKDACHYPVEGRLARCPQIMSCSVAFAIVYENVI